MRRDRFITLFEDTPVSSRQGMPAFAVSAVLHGAVAAMLLYAIRGTPRVIEGGIRFPVRALSITLTAPLLRHAQAKGSASHADRPAQSRTQVPAKPAANLPAASAGGEKAGVEPASDARAAEQAAPQAGDATAAADEATPAANTAAPPAADPVQPLQPAVEGKLAAQSLAQIAPTPVPAPQTLVQPDLPPRVLITRPTPLPTVVLWKPETMPVTTIVPPAPQVASSAAVKPSMAQPNHEQAIADVRVSSAASSTLQLAVQPSTTSPLTTQNAEATPKLPETTSPQHQRPTPTAVLSITPVRMVDGTVALPAANQVAATTPVPGPVVPERNEPNPSSGKGKAGAGRGPASAGPAAQAAAKAGAAGGKDSAAGGKGSAATKTGAPGNAQQAKNPAGQGKAATPATPGKSAIAAVAGKPEPQPASAGTQAGSGSGSGAGSRAGSSPSAVPAAGASNGDAGETPAEKPGARNGDMPGNLADNKPGDKSGSETAAASSPGEVQISFPKDGRFGAVIVGAGLEDTYPETQGVWNDRLAYTVYLHVGLAKNWILQYALPHSSDGLAGVKPDAPFPYEIARPRIESGDVNADALLVHGFVNATGRFEQLSIAFPPDFARSEFVLKALEKWKIRPAMQQGQAIRVEILLIIPDTWD